MSAARDLLFGLLALQNGMITRDQLVAAFGAWTGTPGRPLADFLVDQGALTPSRRALLDALAAEHMAVHGGDLEASLASLEVGPSTRDTLLHVAGQGVESSLAVVGTARRGDGGGTGTGDGDAAAAHWRRVCDAFASVLRRDPAGRAAHLESVCGGDHALRADVDRLLAADARADVEGFLGVPDAAPPPPGGGDPASATTVFPADIAANSDQRFRLLRPHARGGLGAVFVAIDTELNREVALKQILDHHADDSGSRRRFVIEAEVTGGLEHPGIVPVYSLGAYRDGRPYYAMRFIRGDSLKEVIARFHAADAHRSDPGCRSLELRKLLRRFIDVCNAIEYAHSRGVLHRDIKPANVVVGRYGETLVVDWGLAKPLGHAAPEAAADERTLVPSSGSGAGETLPGSAVGTPAYMSPEQASGDLGRLGTRSDVYSLGATLYCLLTGKAPFHGDGGEVLRKVERGDFAPPRRLDPSIDQALEAVCLKAMATKPDDRYASCRALADDVERWAADEPVTSYAEPLARRVRRWAKRNRTAVTAAAAALVAGLVGLAAVAAMQSRWNAALTKADGETRAALTETRKAQKETLAALEQSVESRKQAEAVGAFLVDTFKKPDPLIDGKDVKVADILGHAMDGLAKGFSGSKATEGALLEALGKSYLGLGLYQKAAEAHRRALEVREAALGPEHADTLASRTGLANAYLFAGRRDEAVKLLEAVLKLMEAKLGPDHHDTLDTRMHLTDAYTAAGRRDEAVKLHEATLKRVEAKLGPDHRDTLESRAFLANFYVYAGRSDEAVKLMEATLKRVEAKLGPDHPDTLKNRARLAMAHLYAGRSDEAVKLMEATLKPMEAKLGPDHPDTLKNRLGLAKAYLYAGRRDEAVKLHEATLKRFEPKYGPDHPDTLYVRTELAKAYFAVGRTEEAVKLHEATLKRFEATLGPDLPYTFVIRTELAKAYFAAGRSDEAVKLHEATLKHVEAKLGPDHRDTLQCRTGLAMAYQDAGRSAEAITMYESALKQMESTLGPDHPDTLAPRQALAAIYEASRRWADAEPHRRTVSALRRKTEKPGDISLDDALAALGENLVRQEKWSEAVPTLRECLAFRRKTYADGWPLFVTMSYLGAALLGQGHPAEAEPLLLDGYHGLHLRKTRLPSNSRHFLTEAGERVVQLYKGWGKPDQAAAWASKLGLADLPNDVFAPE